MALPADAPSISSAISGVNSGLIAVGSNIRQQAIQLSVAISPGDPAALGRLEEAIRLERIPGRVTRWGRDFPALIGREDVVEALRSAVEGRQSVSTYGNRRIGKSVLLRHLAPRIGTSFRDGVARIPAGGMLWQDIGQEIVRAFYRSRVSIYLSVIQLEAALLDLDVLLLLDDVSPEAGIEQLTTLLAEATFVLASPAPLLTGEAVTVPLRGLDPDAVPSLINQTLTNVGAGNQVVDPDVGRRIGIALGGHPERIIGAVREAHERGLDLAALADEVAASPGATAMRMATKLSVRDRALVQAVDALGGARVGAAHVVAVTPGASDEQLAELVWRGVLSLASPQVRLNPWLRDGLGLAAREETRDAEGVRERYARRLARWIWDEADSATAVAEESEAILLLLGWAERTGRFDMVHELSVAAEAPMALAGRWATWAQISDSRLRAAERLGLARDAAVAINQIGVQRLSHDDPAGARRAFREALRRARRAGADDVARIARHNLRTIGGAAWPVLDLRVLSVLGLGMAVVGLIVWMLLPRPGLAIQPVSGEFSVSEVLVDSDPLEFTITNSGSGVISGLRVELRGADAGQFRLLGADCGPATELAPDESCVITLGYRPSSPHAGSAELVVTAADGTSITATVMGIVVGPEATDEPTETARPSTPQPSPTPPAPSATPLTPLPDLTIGRFTPRRTPGGSDDAWIIPVEVLVRNEGATGAGIFGILVTANGDPVLFQVDDDDSVPQLTLGPLGPGQELLLAGDIVMGRSHALDVVNIEVEADSCYGLEDASAFCRIQEEREDNNVLGLQVIDLRVSDLEVGEPRLPADTLEALPAFIPLSFTVANDGNLATDEFWLTAYVGQLQPPLTIEGQMTDPETGAVRIDSLDAGQELSTRGFVMVPREFLSSQLVIVAGCEPRVDPCLMQEIWLDDNWTFGDIPPPVPFSPPPTSIPTQPTTQPPDIPG